jgi:peroxiredoxin family protein/TusA-related sulfurtransferase
METSQNLVDCRGMMCPAPILRVAEAARGGTMDALTILATDPDFPADIEAWCRSARARLLEVEHRNDGSIRAEVLLTRKPQAAVANAVSGIVAAAPASSSRPKQAAISALRPAERPSGFAEPIGGILDIVGAETRTAMRELQARYLLGKPFEVVFERALDSKLLSWASAVDAHVDVLDRGVDTMRVRIATESIVAELAPRVATSVASTMPETFAAPPARSLGLAASTMPECAAANLPPPRENQTTLLVIKNDYESLLSALMVANAAAAQGMKVKIFFAFWAINMLRAPRPREGTKRIAGFMQRMLKRMMPRGIANQRLGKLNMGGLGKTIFLWIMKRKNIMNLEQLVDQAVQQNIDFVVCSMSMGMMGIDAGEIISLPNIKFAGVTSFAAEASQSCTSLVF